MTEKPFFSRVTVTRKQKYQYHAGFGNEIESEALPNTLPHGQTTPLRCAYGLYAEQLSGMPFTAPRASQQRSWLYKKRPSVASSTGFEKVPNGHLTSDFSHSHPDPNQLGWTAPPIPQEPEKVDFISGLHTIAGAGSPSMKSGVAVHFYVANVSMEKTAFYNSDGDFLIVPQHGGLDIRTEFGCLEIFPREICVIPRGIKFSVSLLPDPTDETGKIGVRGYICEVYDSHFRIPDLGPIGANGLANPRDFRIPVASFEEDSDYTIFSKFQGHLFKYTQDHSPFDVVGWHGNYYPYKYDLSNFVVFNTVTVDHPDPSIFTVLTAPTALPGTAAVDFVCFRPRYIVQQNTFRPPYYHRNCMSEMMVNIEGVYEAKRTTFPPGGATLHSCMSGHGPDTKTYETIVGQEPEKANNPGVLADQVAIMFESWYMFSITDYAKQHNTNPMYRSVWDKLPCHYSGPESK